jgi:hypothetical protein
MPYIEASFSADSPSAIVHWAGIWRLTIPQPSVVECGTRGRVRSRASGFRSTHRARLIDSTQPTTTSEWSPTSMPRLAIMAASSDEYDLIERRTVGAGPLEERPRRVHGEIVGADPGERRTR